MSFIMRHRILPLRNIASRMTVGFVDPFEASMLLRIKNLLPSMDIKPVSISAQLFNDVLKGFSGRQSTQESSPSTEGDLSSPIQDISKTMEAGNLRTLLLRVVSEGASDLHLSAGLKPRWRIDGEMIEIHDQPILGQEQVLEWVRPVMREASLEEFLESNDTDFAIPLDDIARFRVNIFKDQNGLGAVFRLIPSKILSVQQLGLSNVLLKLASLPKGLVLVTGPTGSGKSTTLAAMIDYINKSRNEHIITLEDPIEFVHQSRKCLVNQREIGQHTNSFSRALRAALRQDPDIVLVGELRDLETIQLAIEVANTGHLVFGTLHTATAMTTVDRMVDMFPANQQNQIRSTLSEVLQGVVSQTLLKKRGGGRVAALEVLIVNPAVSNLIREGKTSQVATMMQTGKARGNCMLNDALSVLVQKREVSYEEALSKSMDKSDLARRLNKTHNP
jgi:twitching motility protein PilT